MLVVLMYFPGGLISLLHNARDTMLTWMANKTDWSPAYKGHPKQFGHVRTAVRY